VILNAMRVLGSAGETREPVERVASPQP
jgi:hypothetical protein